MKLLRTNIQENKTLRIKYKIFTLIFKKIKH